MAERYANSLFPKRSKSRPVRLFAAVVLATSASLTSPALAVDGVIEINHAKALRGAVTASDLPGYPVTIDAPGSYRLTGNLTIADQFTVGVDITASDVTLDLNDFTISGPTVCSGTPTTSCTPASAQGVAIRIANTANGVTIENGTVRGAGGDGIATDTPNTSAGGTRIEGVRVIANGGTGIYIGPGSIVSDCTVLRNGAFGIFPAAGSIVVDNVVTDNGVTGYAVAGSSHVARNVARNNGGAGLSTQGGSVVTSNVVTDNGSHGVISTTPNLVVAENTASENGGYGIGLTGSDALAVGNVATDNASSGLSGSPGVGYAGNLFNGNDDAGSGANVLGCTQLGDDLCGGDTTCP